MIELNQVYFTGGNIIKVVGYLPNVSATAVEALTWVKSKKAFTKKTSCFGWDGNSHWQKLSDSQIDNLKK